DGEYWQDDPRDTDAGTGAETSLRDPDLAASTHDDTARRRGKAGGVGSQARGADLRRRARGANRLHQRKSIPRGRLERRQEPYRGAPRYARQAWTFWRSSSCSRPP